MAKRFDAAKDEINKAKHSISLARAFDMEIVRFIKDERFDYGEVRYCAWASSTVAVTISRSPCATALSGQSACAARMQRR